MIQRTKGLPLTDDFLQSFGRLYHAFKSVDLCSGDITAVFMRLLDVSDSTVRRYIRKAREKGYITDTYLENRAAMIERQRGSVATDTKMKEFIFENISYKESKEETKKKTVKKPKKK